jgi:glycosyltransferase involved in cell wall biosynthesis
MWPDHLPKSQTHPSVSILTPTYNRRAFLPFLIQHIKAQTYPKERMEWVVLDDGTDSILDILTPHMTDMNIRYIRSDEKLNVGAKRNRLNAEARGEILVCMDDDDWYSPDRVAHAVHVLRANPRAGICGSSRNFLYFTDDESIWEVGPFGPTHATFGTMAYRKSYVTKHTCDETVLYAEEVSFTNKYSESLAQLDPNKVMLVTCHPNNTFDKRGLRTADNPMMKKTALKLKQFVKSAAVRDFYKTLVDRTDKN